VYYGTVLETVSLLSWLLLRSCAENWVRIGDLHDDVLWIDYNHQNPSGFFSLMQIGAIVI